MNLFPENSTFKVDKQQYTLKMLTMQDALEIVAPITEGWWIFKKTRDPTEYEKKNIKNRKR